MKWISVDTILENWNSVDYNWRWENRQIPEWKVKQILKGNLSQIQVVLDLCKKDSQYKTIKKSIKKYGFRMCLQHDEDCQCDGHHRLAAAIELGYKYIPYITDCGAEKDSWNFDIQDFVKISSLPEVYLHPENPLPEIPSIKSENI